MSSKSNILYYAHKFPFPANDGGEQAFSNNIKILSQSKYGSDIIFFFSNLMNKKNFCDLKINYKLFELAYSNKIILNVLRFVYVFISFYPAIYHFVATQEIKKAIKNINPDIIILDGAYGDLILPKNNNYSFIYIAHNIEYQLSLTHVKLEKNLFVKALKYINYFKTKNIEEKALIKAKKIICISTSDYKYFKGLYPEKTVLIPHKINLSNEPWMPKDTKTLFFCGHLDFAPNYDAAKWIIEELSPVLSKDIKIKISGRGTDNVPDEWKKDNIEFLGFISKEELINLYRTSNAFICPIVHGSGIKIKVTEALSYGMPIIATKEALEGLDYVNIKPLIDRNNLQQTKENIENLLNDKEQLQKYSNDLLNQIKIFQAENDCSYEKIIDEMLQLK